jgi:dihydrofolate synthase/folylpolyglutamate synthase
VQRRYGIRLGLGRVLALLRAMGNPEGEVRGALVAGTNGKGSVIALAGSALRAAGYRVGETPKPHLVSYRERIVVDGRPIEPEAFVRLVGEAVEAADRVGRRLGPPTEFELLTAVMFRHFAASALDVALVEVGLGGRLDATGVAEPLVSAVVSLDFDHESFLGTTLDAIAREKAGVMRARRSVVLGPVPEEAHAALLDEARRKGARVVEAREGARVAEAAEGRVTVVTAAHTWPRMRPLPGAHQRDNLLVAVRVLEEARAAGLPVQFPRAAQGISRVRWPGRLQRLLGRPPLLLDGAHNPAGARALAAHLRGQFSRAQIRTKPRKERVEIFAPWRKPRKCR